MAAEFKSRGELYQNDAAAAIPVRFGMGLLRENEGGNAAIDRKVFAAFRCLTEDAIWDRGELCWRKREAGDPSGRMAE